MNDPRITEEIMNQERSRSWLMNPPPTPTDPLPAPAADPDPEPDAESAEELNSRGKRRLTPEEFSEVRRKAALLRYARRRAQAQGGNGTAQPRQGDRSADAKSYWAKLTPEERSAEMARRRAVRKAKTEGRPQAQPMPQSSASQSAKAPAVDPKLDSQANHSLVEQLQAIQARGDELAKAAAQLLSLIIH